MSSTEAEVMLNKVKATRNKFDKENGTVTPAFRYLRTNEKQSAEEELGRIERRLSAPEWVQSGMSDEGRRTLARRSHMLQRQLKDYSPPTDLSGETKDALETRRKYLEEKITNKMPPREVMRRNPPGAVDWSRNWEAANKDYVLEWKNIKRVQNPDSDARDLANIEVLRPSIMRPGETTFMADAQIPGHFAFSNVPAENWQRTFGETKVDTPLRQAERVEAEEDVVAKLMAEINDLKNQVDRATATQPKRVSSPEAREKRLVNIKKAQDALKAKREAQKQQDT
jgi:hypothetical protein